MCNPTGCTFCAGISVFGSIMMLIIGVLVQKNYPYLGEWYEKGDNVPGQPAPEATPTEDQILVASQNCFTVMGIYMGFTVLSLVCLCFMKKR